MYFWMVRRLEKLTFSLTIENKICYNFTFGRPSRLGFEESMKFCNTILILTQEHFNFYEQINKKKNSAMERQIVTS